MQDFNGDLKRRSRIVMSCGVIALSICAHGAFAQVDVHDMPQWPADVDLSLDGKPSATWNDDDLPPPQLLKGIAIDPTLRALVNQLEDPNFEAREEASRKLSELSPDPIQLYAVLAQDNGLSAEQRYRLLSVLRETLIKTPRGAIGISMQPMPVNMGAQLEIRVTDLLPGLPAERVLKRGDRITEVDGRPLTMTDDLQFRVQSKKPGEKVALTVKRTQTDAEGRVIADQNNQPVDEVLHIDLELGSADLLRKFDQPFAMNGLNQQFGQMPTRVERNREIAAEKARHRYAPAPRSITVPNDSSLVARANSRAGAFGDSGEEFLDPEVEEQPLIQQLRWQQELIKQGKLSKDEQDALAKQWNLQLGDLYRQLQDGRLSNQKRDLLKRVISRFVDLMQF